MSIIKNCFTCNDLLFRAMIQVDNKTYNKTSFILYDSKEKEKAFCSFGCKLTHEQPKKGEII
jgi:hypothetical protein